MSETSPPLSVPERLIQMAARRSGLDAQTIDRHAGLDSLGIDSLGMAEMMFDIDDEFGIEITDEHMGELRTVDDLIVLIERLAAERPVS